MDVGQSETARVSLCKSWSMECRWSYC